MRVVQLSMRVDCARVDSSKRKAVRVCLKLHEQLFTLASRRESCFTLEGSPWFVVVSYTSLPHVLVLPPRVWVQLNP